MGYLACPAPGDRHGFAWLGLSQTTSLAHAATTLAARWNHLGAGRPTTMTAVLALDLNRFEGLRSEYTVVHCHGVVLLTYHVT